MAFFVGYNPQIANSPNFFEGVANNLDKPISQYDNILFEDFNVELKEKILTDLYWNLYLKT